MVMVGVRLRRARLDWQRRTKKRIAELVDEVGIPKPTIFAWESERFKVDPVDLRRLLEFYGTPESEILDALDLRSRPAGHVASNEPAGLDDPLTVEDFPTPVP
jgi:transcriptional regulator with XRE-family HTH domain